MSRQQGERFAKIPLELLKEPAVTTLPHAAFRMLVILAAGYSGGNNGTLAATDKWVKQFGMVSKDTTYSALHELIERGLIEVTRPGMKYRRLPTLYAITWQSINNRNGKVLGVFSAPSHRYRHWKAPARTPKKVPDRRKSKRIAAEFQSGDRTSRSPMVGPMRSPINPTKVQDFQSDDREYSKNLGRVPDLEPSSHSEPPTSAPPQNGAAAKIEKLFRVHPEYSEADLAKIACEPVELVREVRAVLERQR